MNIISYYLLLDDEETPFIFEVDTRNVVSGATDGSENPLSFRIPAPVTSGNSGIVIKVSDGRPDIGISGSTTTANLTLTFTTPGVYEIKIYGRFNSGWTFYLAAQGFDRLKITKVKQWPSNTLFFAIRAFQMCSNLVINAPNVLVLPTDSGLFFQSIKGFESDLSLFDTSKCVTAVGILQLVQNNFNSLLNPFWLNLTSFNNVYSNAKLTASIDKIEVISNSITLFSQALTGLTTPLSTIRVVFKTPNLTNMFRFFFSGDIRTKAHGGEIDVRSVNDTSNWLTGTFSTWQVDATLLGWAQLPYMQAGVTWNWNGSKYSNNPAVIAAYNKITVQWGVIFTNLTMA
jgi:hypothetical protein